MKATLILLCFSLTTPFGLAWSVAATRKKQFSRLFTAQEPATEEPAAADKAAFDDFVEFLKERQQSIIDEIEAVERKWGSKAAFSNDPWGVFDPETDAAGASGGITRVIQGGDVIEKGACSLTLITRGILTAERAATIRARNDVDIRPGDLYSAAALSMVLHTRSPMVPTFRSDVRIFMVKDSTDDTAPAMAWFGGGADLTPYYLFRDDIAGFHTDYRDLCDQHLDDMEEFSYIAMKEACDAYFYLPARAEHRGTGGIFYDDMPLSEASIAFTKDVVDTWMPSWLPIVERRQAASYSQAQKQWQLLRRGRYLEFNLLYDRGVKFGLSNANPRVEGVMVSAPPIIAYEYNHKVEGGSREEELMKILKEPIDWV